MHAEIKQGHLRAYDDQLAELEQRRRRVEEPMRPAKAETIEVQSERQPLTLEALALADKTLESQSILKGYDGRKEADEEIVSIDQVRHTAEAFEVNEASFSHKNRRLKGKATRKRQAGPAQSVTTGKGGEGFLEQVPIPGSYYKVSRRLCEHEAVWRQGNGSPPRKAAKRAAVKKTLASERKLNAASAASAAEGTTRKRLLEEMRGLQEQIKMQEVKEVDHKMKQVQQSHEESESLLLKQLEAQRELFLQQQLERRRAEEEQLRELEEAKHKEAEHDECTDWRCQECNPPPPIHPEYGPPVYDPYFKCWTYPYAQNIPKRVPKEKPPSPAKPETHEMEVQADYQPEPKPPVNEIPTQTVCEI